MLYDNRRQEVKDRQKAKTIVNYTSEHKQVSEMCIEMEATITALETALPPLS